MKLYNKFMKLSIEEKAIILYLVIPAIIVLLIAIFSPETINSYYM